MPESRHRSPFAPALLVLALVTPAAADDFADFRVPDHRVWDWTAALVGDLQRSANGQGTANDRSHRAWGTLRTRSAWLWDSDRRRTRVGLDAWLQGLRGTSESDRTTVSPGVVDREEVDGLDRFVRERVDVTLAHRHHPWRFPLGVEVAASAGGIFGQGWYRRVEDARRDGPVSAQYLQTTDDERWDYDTRFSGSAALGLGRVRDATPVYEARVLEERLRASGALTRALSPGARQRLAGLLAMRRDLAAARERPERELWREVTRLLAEDGALRAGGLEPHEVLRAAEPVHPGVASVSARGLPESPLARSRGSFAGLRYRGSSAHRVTRYDRTSLYQSAIGGVPDPPFRSTTGYRSERWYDLHHIGGFLEHHRPIGPRGQLDAYSELMVPSRRERDGFSSRTDVQLGWIVADRWFATAQVRHLRDLDQAEDGFTDLDTWQWETTARVSWYLEDHLALTLTLGEWQRRERTDASFTSTPETPRFSRDGGIRLGLDYRFRGRFVAPGYSLPPDPAPASAVAW